MHLDPDKLHQLLHIEDLTQNPTHAIGSMVKSIEKASMDLGLPVKIISGEKIVSKQENYHLLGYPDQSVMMESTYTHHVNDELILRTQTTSLILGELINNRPLHPTVLLAPGMVYRRDVRDRWHCAQPHQIDIWVLRQKNTDTPETLQQFIHHLCALVLPGVVIQTVPTTHPYTTNGVEIQARWQDQWLEIGEAGLIDPELLSRVGINSNIWGGLAMGLGLDRLVLCAKQCPDIRLLRDPLPTVAQQMNNLSPWVPVSRQPKACRQLSVLRPKSETEEDLVEHILQSANPHQDWIENITVKGRWCAESLPKPAQKRLGVQDQQDNLLIEISCQAPSTSLPREEINQLVRQIYLSVHQGTNWECCPGN